jgi:hypothetical protein
MYETLVRIKNMNPGSVTLYGVDEADDGTLKLKRLVFHDYETKEIELGELIDYYRTANEFIRACWDDIFELDDEIKEILKEY